MVKLHLLPAALVGILAGSSMVLGQDSSVSNSSPSATGSSVSSASRAEPTSMVNSASANSAQVCTVLVGDPRHPPHGCHFSSTSTPPYDLSSLVSYLVGGYTHGKEAEPASEVANELAGSVLKYYPTLTTPRSVIAETFLHAISATISAARDGHISQDAASQHLPHSLLSFSMAAAAVVAAGAFYL